MNAEQGGERFGADERAVAAEDERVGVGGAGLEVRLGHHHGVASAQLLVLQHKLDGVAQLRHAGEVLANHFGAVANHKNDLGCSSGARSVDDPMHHRPAKDWMHDLRNVRLHARSLASSENDSNELAVGTGVGK